MSRTHKARRIGVLGVVGIAVGILCGCDALTSLTGSIPGDEGFVAVDLSDIGGTDGLTAKAGVVESELATVTMPDEVLVEAPDDVTLTLRAESITVVIDGDTAARHNPASKGQERHASITFRMAEQDFDACSATETIGPFVLTISDGVVTVEQESFPLSAIARSLARSSFAMCSETEADFNGSIDLGGISFEFGRLPSNEESVLLCHIPPEDEGDPHTITVGSSSVNAHLEHGDYLGDCNEPDDDGTSTDDATDTDGDSVFDSVDTCPETPAGDTVDVSGCSCTQRDGDSDGVDDCSDACPHSTSGDAVDASGSAEEDSADDDEDGVSNGTDACPDTFAGESVDSVGCACSQLDGDVDGVTDCDDDCPNSDSAAVVDAVGCADTDLDDDDGDGIVNGSDTCANTLSGESVDSTGCSCSQKDADADGVNDCNDTCTSTSAGLSVNTTGCATNQIDDDSDGVMNDAEVCANTATGTTVDASGCVPLSANAGSDTTIAINSTTTLGGPPAASGGDGSYTYAWSPTTGLSDPNTANPVFTASSEGTFTFTLTVTYGVGNSSTDTMTVTVYAPSIYPDTVLNTVSVGDRPWAVAVSPDSSHVYVTNGDDGTMSIIRTSDHTVTDTVVVGNSPRGLAISADGSRVYVCVQDAKSVAVVLTSDHSIAATISVSQNPVDVAVAPDGNHIYVTTIYDSRVLVIRTSDNSLVATVSDFGNYPMHVAVSPDKQLSLCGE